MKPIRVLQIATYMGRGGLETMIMNYYRHIDRDKVQFDFLVHRDFKADYDDEIEQLGGKIYRLPNLNPFSKNYLEQIDKFFAQHKEYKIVHSHLDCMAGIPLKYAKKHGVPVRIAHAHSCNQTKDKKYLLKLWFKRSITQYTSHLFACADVAGRWMFNTSDFRVLNNAIDSKNYVYNQDTVNKVRAEFDLKKDDFVIGHVGRFAPPKNHSFIVDIFNEIYKHDSDAKLLLVGEGELKNTIEQKVRNLQLDDKVIFAGLRSDVPELLQAMDVFVFPSIYEGLPVSIVEAQAAGLPCFISDKVPIECKKTDLVKQISLTDSLAFWTESILSMKGFKKKDYSRDIEKAGFDIVKSANWLENFYLCMWNRNNEE